MSKAIIETLLTANNTKFKAGISGANDSVGKFSKGNISKVAGIIASAFAVHAIINFGKEMMSTADNIDNLSKRLEISTNSVQMLQKVADDAGFSFGKFESSIIKSNAAQAEAITENGMMRKSFEKMGISIDDLKNMSPEETFKKLSKAISINGDDMQALDGYYEIFGKRAGGTLLTEMKKLGAEGFDETSKKMIEQNRILDADSIRILDEYEQKLKETGESAKNFLTKTLVEITSGIQAFGTVVSGTYTGLVENLSDVIIGAKSLEDGMDGVSDSWNNAWIDAGNKITGVNEDLRMLTKEEKNARDKAEQLAQSQEKLAKATGNSSDKSEKNAKSTNKESAEIENLKKEIADLTNEIQQANAQKVSIKVQSITKQQLESWKEFFKELKITSKTDVAIDIDLPSMTKQKVKIWGDFLDLWRYAQADVSVALDIPNLTNHQVGIWKSFIALWKNKKIDVSFNANIPKLSRSQIKLWDQFFKVARDVNSKIEVKGLDSATVAKYATLINQINGMKPPVFNIPAMPMQQANIKMAFTMPSSLSNGIPIDVSALQNVGISSIATSLQTLAALKGTVWI